MVAFSKADRLLGQYKTVYGDDNEESVEFMCGEYANEWAALAKVLVAQREEVNADEGLNKAAKLKREVQIGAKSDLGIINMIHGLLVADAMIDSMGEEEMKTEQLVGAVQRECRDCHVSVMGVEQNLVSMKRQVFEAREWEWDATEMDEDEEYEVKAILGVSLENGFRSYRVQWSDLTEGWEPEDSLTNVAEMLLEFHAEEDRKAAAACRKGSGRKARKKKQVVIEESASDSDEAEKPSSKRAKAGEEEMRQCMM